MPFFKLVLMLVGVSCSLSSCKQDEVPEPPKLAFEMVALEAHQKIVVKQKELQEKFYLDDCDSIKFSVEDKTLTWFKKGLSVAKGEVLILGSLDKDSSLWRWSWQDIEYKLANKEKFEQLRSYGFEHKIEKLRSKQLIISETEAWDLTAVAAHVLGADGIYSHPHGKGFDYMAIMRISAAE